MNNIITIIVSIISLICIVLTIISFLKIKDDPNNKKGRSKFWDYMLSVGGIYCLILFAILYFLICDTSCNVMLWRMGY